MCRWEGWCRARCRRGRPAQGPGSPPTGTRRGVEHEGQFEEMVDSSKAPAFSTAVSNNMQSVVQMFKVLNMPRKNEHHYIGANGTFSISVMWMMVVITLMMGWMRLISP